MKVTELKIELEKVARFIPGLRDDLDKFYAGESYGKKSRLKEIWRQYEDRYKEVINSKEYRTLH